MISSHESFIIQTQTFSDLVEQIDEADTVLVDMPIGLARDREETACRPEKQARELIPKKGASIFNAPSELTAYCTTYKDANAMNRHITGKGLSKQSYHICKKVREVDMFIKYDSVRGSKLMESHPEVCFARLHPNKNPILQSKRTAEGRQLRLALLKSYAPDIVATVEQTLDVSMDLQRIADDVIDATCLAIVAFHGLKWGFRTVPETPCKNSYDIPMQMVYYEHPSF